MNQKYSFTFLLLLVLNPLLAQVGVVPLDEYEDFKKRTLVVIVEEPQAKLLSKLAPEQQNIYKTEIEDYNQLVKWAMDTYYKVGNPVQYMLRSEVEPLIEKQDRSITYLEYTKFSDNYITKASFDLVQKNRFAKEQNRLTGALSLNSIVSLIEIRFPEVPDDGLPFYGQYLPDPFPDKADMAYAFKQIAATFDYREAGITYDKVEKLSRENAKKLQTLTLLIAEDDLDANEDRGKFMDAYKFPKEIVSREKIREAILSSDSKYACVLSVPQYDTRTEEVKFQFQAVECEKGITLVVSEPQDKAGISAGPMVALKSLKKATDSKLPPVRKENLWDFERFAR